MISLSQLVNCVHLDLLHWWDHIPSNLKSFHKDYYGLKPIRIHRELGSDILFKLLLTGRPCILGLLMDKNKIWTFIIVPYKSCGSPRRFSFILQLRKGFNRNKQVRKNINFFSIIQKYNVCLIFLPNFKAKFVYLPDFFTILICQFYSHH